FQIRRVAGKHDLLLAVAHDDGDVVWRVSRRRHGDDVAGFGDAGTARKWSVRRLLPRKRLRVEPFRPPARQITPDRSGDARRARNLTSIGENTGVWEIRETAVVVTM